MSVEGAYSGLRVLDLGQGVAAPYCAMLLAMHGAEIVKLEPIAGDWSRGLGTQYGDHTAMSAHYNRGKRSLALDLRSPAGREIAVRSPTAPTSSSTAFGRAWRRGSALAATSSPRAILASCICRSAASVRRDHTRRYLAPTRWRRRFLG